MLCAGGAAEHAFSCWRCCVAVALPVGCVDCLFWHANRSQTIIPLALALHLHLQFMYACSHFELNTWLLHS